MPVSSQVVRFQKSTGGNGTTQDVNLTFTPKAIIVFSSGGTTDAATAAHFQQIVGFSDGTNHACYATQSEDAATAADAGRIHYNNRVFAKLDTATVTTVVCQGTCVFATNKVTFTWTVNDAVATYITLIAYGGDDITAAKVNTVDIGRTTVGDQNYTGLGFNPADNTSVLFTIAAFVQTINTATDHAIGAFGCATKALPGGGAGNQWCLAHCSEDVSDPSDTWRAYNNDRVFDVLNTTGAYAHYSSLKAWVSDGFQFYWDGPPTATDFKFSYLVINGGNWDSGTLTAPTTATNDVDYTVLSGITTFTPKSLILTTHGTTAGLGTINTYSIGTTDGTSSSAIGAIDEDAQNTMDSYRYSDATGIQHLMGTNGATTNRATFDSFSTNNFRLDWGTKDATASVNGWVVVADQTEPPPGEAVEVFPHSYGKIHTHFDNNIGPAIFG